MVLEEIVVGKEFSLFYYPKKNIEIPKALTYIFQQNNLEKYKEFFFKTKVNIKINKKLNNKYIYVNM